MDVIIREIKLNYIPDEYFETVTGRTENGELFEYEGVTYNLKPDCSKDFNLKIFLKSENIEMGLFESSSETDNIDDYEADVYTVTGVCSSRLYELENYGYDNEFVEKYKPNGNLLVDGVDYVLSVEDEIIAYYIGGVKYIDDILNNITYYSFSSSQYEDNFVNSTYIKLLGRCGFSDEIIKNNIFVERQNISAFDGNTRLEYLDRLIVLETYAGGKFFKINNNN